MAVLLLWIFFVTYVLCFSYYLVVCLLQSCGHLLGEITSWLYCMRCFIVFLSLSDGVSWVKCCTLLYRFLIFASFLTLRNESKIICVSNGVPRIAAWLIGKGSFSILEGGGKASEPNFNTCRGVLQKCTYTHVCTHA